MKSLTLHIEGMSCGHCLNAVNKALGGLDLVIDSVRIGRATVQYDESRTSPEAIALAVSNAGYRATPAQAGAV